MPIAPSELKEFLDSKVEEFNNTSFIAPDPISVPHKYSLKEDIEIAGFLAATIAWGNRTMIIRNANKMTELMGNQPFEFVMEAKEEHLHRLDDFVHRTFNGEDFKTFVLALRNIYRYHDGLEGIFTQKQDADSLQGAISVLKKTFFEIEHLERTKKHVSDPLRGSAAKRINMYLRWMVRNDRKGVDFGLWKDISPAKL